MALISFININSQKKAPTRRAFLNLVLYYSSGSGSCIGIGLPVALIIGDAVTGVVPQLGAGAKVLAVFPPNGAAPNDGLLKLAVAPPKLALALNPLGLGVVGAGLTVGALLAASSALALKSLSPPANMIPLSVPVKNVAIGIINSKNF